MKRIILLFGILIIIAFSLTGCKDKEIEEDVITFKEEYESLNGEVSNSGRDYRSVSIDEDNPYIYITAEELIEKMDNGESFYVYFGSSMCPWCRSVIETATEVANSNSISEIYYVDIWDDDGNEILRDKYIINDNNELEQTIEGTSTYYEILERFNDFLDDYTLTDDDGKEVNVGEKRLYAPTFVFIENGEVSRLVTGIPDSLNSPYDELTEEIKNDQEEIFEEFFSNLCTNELC